MNAFTWPHVRMAIGAIGTILFATSSVVAPHLRYPSLFFMVVSLALIWREYQHVRPM